MIILLCVLVALVLIVLLALYATLDGISDAMETVLFRIFDTEIHE